MGAGSIKSRLVGRIRAFLWRHSADTCTDNPVVACIECGTADPALHYRSGLMARCYDCQNFLNLSVKKTGGGVGFTRAEFVAWKRSDPSRRRCRYCGVDAATLYALDVPNPRNGRRLETIGVDRVDNDLPYSLENIVPCCALCNQVKSQLLTYEEMVKLGPSLRALWDARLLRR